MSTHDNRIPEKHKVDIHKSKINNVQTERYGPKINGCTQALLYKHALPICL